MDSITQWKRQKTRKNIYIGATTLGIVGALFGSIIGMFMRVETNEERAERIKRENIETAERYAALKKYQAEQAKLSEEKESRILELRKQKIEIERQLNELDGRKVVGYIYERSWK